MLFSLRFQEKPKQAGPKKCGPKNQAAQKEAKKVLNILEPNF